MSKTFIFKRNRSQDMWRPVQQTPNSRRRSLTRERESSSTRAGVYKSEFPLHESLTRSSDTIGTQLSPSMRRVGSSSSPGERHKLQRHRDLKRKFIFQLHEEIEKPIHTTVLEEISDLDRITSICLSTLHQMMENKHQRKFLHHMNISNNNNSYFDKDKSDNSSAGTTLKGKKNYDKLTSEIPERQDSKTNQTVQRVLQESIQIRKQMATPRKESIALVF